MSEKIVARNYCSDDLENVKEILFEYPSPTGTACMEMQAELATFHSSVFYSLLESITI